MSRDLLTVRGLNKTYPSGVRALKNINLDVREGEFLVVIGLSGSGKTTLLRCLNGLLKADSGEIIFHGQRREIAMIFQTFNLVPRLSVMANVLAGRLAYTPFWKSLCGLFTAEDRSLARACLERVGISEKAGMRADQLSGGQQQRVAIARAFCQKPKLLLADEPVASLDPATCHTVMDDLRQAHRELGITVVCNLHFLSLVREYATRVVALRDGEIVFQGAPSEIDEAWFKRIYGETARDVDVR